VTQQAAIVVMQLSTSIPEWKAIPYLFANAHHQPCCLVLIGKDIVPTDKKSFQQLMIVNFRMVLITNKRFTFTELAG
jgi:hypothetical protein